MAYIRAREVFQERLLSRMRDARAPIAHWREDENATRRENTPAGIVSNGLFRGVEHCAPDGIVLGHADALQGWLEWEVF